MKQDSLCCHPILRAVALTVLCCAPLLYLVCFGLNLTIGALPETQGWAQGMLLLASLIFPVLILPRFEAHWQQPGEPWDFSG